MNLDNIKYFLRQAFNSLQRNRFLSFATISTVGICILILGIALITGINASNFMNRLESDVEIITYLNKDLTTSQISDLKVSIRKIEGINSIDFVSKDAALQELEKSLGNRDLGASVGGNPLPDSFAIKAKDPHEVPNIAAEIGKLSGIDKINYGQGLVERLFQVTSWIRMISVILVILLAIGAVFLIATTIRLAIFARRKEVYLMKLIGATDWFIRWPFFIEGIFMGITGALVSTLILAAGYTALLKNTQSFFFLPLVANPVVLLYLYLALIIIGAGMGIIGTYISLNRFLDV